MHLVPSRRRIEKLREFANSLVATKTSTPGLVLVDKVDYTDNQQSYMDIEMYHLPTMWKIHVTEAEGMGPKVREVWDRVRDAEWVNILNDDHYCVTDQWDKRLIRQLDGTNFVTCNDRYMAPQRAAGATVFSMGLVRAFGFPLFPPEIDHLGIDDVFETIGRSTGCWKIDMSVVVEHRHVFTGKENDETHKKVYGEGQWQGSPQALATKAAFEKCMKETIPGAIERVRALRRGVGAISLPG